MFLPILPSPAYLSLHLLPEDCKPLVARHAAVPVASAAVPSSSAPPTSRPSSLIERMMKKKPYTAVTVQIDRLTLEGYDENDVSGIPDLIQSIQLQDTGPTEASRAIRKKLKYGSVHRQLRALTILDALIANAGETFQRSFADEPLLERLRIAATDPVSDQRVRDKCKTLFAQWYQAYRDIPGCQSVAALYRQLPRARPKPKLRDSPPPTGQNDTQSSSTHARSTSSGNASQSRYAASSTSKSSPASASHSRQSSKKQKHERIPPFNLAKEKDALLGSLASASMASTNLTNALKFINREKERASENSEVMKKFEECKALRRQILRYIQFVESEQYLGSLIQANEQLVEALTYFERMDKPIDEDSDSEMDEWNRKDDEEEDTAVDKAEHETRRPSLAERRGKQVTMPFTAKSRDEHEAANADDDDPDNPFSDQYVAETPAFD